MNQRSSKRSTAALVVAMLSLFVALSGTAGAVVSAAVPLAKRALVADNAKKLGGQTAAQIAAQGAKAAVTLSPAGPRPASSAAGLTVIKTGTGSLAANGGGDFTIACDSGQKVMGGGFTSNTGVIAFDSYPQSDTTWAFFLGNLSDTTPASITLYATCLK